MLWGIALLVVVLSTLAFLISRAGTFADRAIGRDPELGSTAKEVAEDDQALDSRSSRQGKAGS
jgi:Na+-transporting methylmalonyl-CoA/oxaloacetate decarboxylase gamma subunit